MTYPNAPYGQGYPSQQPITPPVPYPSHQYPSYAPQPGFPQQPGHPQPGGYPYPLPGYPGYPGAQQPPGFQPPPTPSPSGITGIIAGVLAALGGAVNVITGGFAVIGIGALLSDPRFSDATSGGGAFIIVAVVLQVVAGVVLSAGAVTLLLRKSIGRWLVVAGCAIYIISAVASLAITSAITRAYDVGYAGSAVGAIGLVFPVATLVLALLPSTAAWTRAKQQSVPAPYPPQYPPQYPPYQG